MEESIVAYYGKQTSRCGYCKGTNGCQSHGMHAYCMTVLDYQDLIDRGWRRCGNYCYKPKNNSTCCPSYTIRCDTLNFKLSKSHKKILKRMNHFLRDGKRDKVEENSMEAKDVAIQAIGDNESVCEQQPQIPNIPLVQLEPATKVEHHQSSSSSKIEAPTTSRTVHDSTAVIAKFQATDKSELNKPPCKKAKQMRLERRQAKLDALADSNPNLAATANNARMSKKSKEKTLSDFINETSSNDKHKLKIVLIASNTKNGFSDVSFRLYCKYQISIHNDNPERLTPAKMQKFLHDSPFKLKLVHVNSQEFMGTLKQSYALYQKYQLRIHNDPPENVKSYLEFLQESPLQYTQAADGPEMGYGSFHQQYWLDDKLIAVGVIDILPTCLSSVYFFYDPDYSFLSLGTYGSLREIDLVQRLAVQTPALKYYYMGFYIHSCPKMRYKGQLTASYLLCPETYTWQLLTDDIRNKLSACKYQRFHPDIKALDVNEFSAEHLDAVKLFVYVTRERITYQQYMQITGDEDDRQTIIEYAQLVGRICAHRMRYLKTD